MSQDQNQSENQSENQLVLDKELYDSVKVAYEFKSSLASAFIDLIERTMVESNQNIKEEAAVIHKELKEFLDVTRAYQTKLSRFANVGNLFIDCIKGFEKAMLLLESKMVQFEIEFE